MLVEVLKTVRALVWIVGLCAVAYILAPAFKPQGRTAVVTDGRVVQEVNALQKAADKLAALYGHAPIYSPIKDPRINVILSGLQPKTQEVARAKTTVQAPAPVPKPTAPPSMTPESAEFYYSTAYSADVAALNATTIKTDVSLTREPAPISRAATLITTQGSGLSFDLIRRNQVNAFVGGLEQKNHLVPVIGASYCLRGTTLCGGPYVSPNHVGASLSVHF